MNAAIFEVAIGLVLIFLVFSLVVSGVYEAVAKVLAWRAKSLWAAIHVLVGTAATPAEAKLGQRLKDAAPIGDVRPRVGAVPHAAGSVTAKLYAHPLVGGLEQRKDGVKTRLDMIEPSSFARALIDVLVPDGEEKTSVDKWAAAVESNTTLPAALKRQLAVLLREAGGDYNSLRSKIETWFDSQMTALTRQYRKRARLFTVVFGLVVASVCNVDAVRATQRLYNDDVTRAALVSQADGLVSTCEGKSGDDLATCLRTTGDTIGKSVELPVGWKDADITVVSPLGWVLAGLAISQGAPFWYDVLKRAMRYRRRGDESS